MTIDTEQLDRAEKLIETGKYNEAESIADAALHTYPSLTNLELLSRAAFLKGKASLQPLLDQLVDDSVEEKPVVGMFQNAWDLFHLSISLDSENDEAMEHIDNMKHLMVKQPKKCNHSNAFDVLVVGAGASGVGVSLMLTRVFGLNPEKVLIVERGESVGETFKRWPKEMRFISPSFNSQGWTNSFDLNSVAFGTSPAFTLHTEHPTGEQYARYLQALVDEAKLRVSTRTEVKAITPIKSTTFFGEGFNVDVTSVDTVGTSISETISARYVIWAAGEFQYPRTDNSLFSGAKHCIHNSSVKSWANLIGDDFVIVGGYESGIDAASNLSKRGINCTVVSSTAYWKVATPDPSTELAPFTADRLRVAVASKCPPRLLAPFRVFQVERVQQQDESGKTNTKYLVHARRSKPAKFSNGQHRVPYVENDEVMDNMTTAGTEFEDEVLLYSPQPPILCAGFEGSVNLGIVKDMFEWVNVSEGSDDGSENGDYDSDNDDNDTETMDEEVKSKVNTADYSGVATCPLLNDFDESTTTPGLFLCGPAVRHDTLSFCYIYKFRQRFGIVANAIAQGLGYNTDFAVMEARNMNMFLDDFSCCKSACGETC
eukprot:g12875.t1